MMRLLRQTFNMFFVVILMIFAFIYLLSYAIEILIFGFSNLSEPFAGMRIFIIIFTSISYGFFRVWSFHPIFNRRYQQWLALTPWRYGMRLPKGPIHLIWVDIVFMGLLTLLAWSVYGYFAPYPVIAFLLSNLFCNLIAFLLTGQSLFALVILFATPLTIYPYRHPFVGLAVLAGLYIWCYFGLRRYLKDFPWETRLWKSNQEKEQMDRFIRQGVIGWPHKMLNTVERQLTVSLPMAALISLLLTWWLHVLIEVTGEPLIIYISIMQIPFLCVFTRLAVYMFLYWSPMGFFGRIFNFRWIIPSYDKIFLAPLIVILIAVYPFVVFGRDCFEMDWLMKVTCFLVLFFTLALPPKRKNWLLLGHYRLLQVKQQQRKTGSSRLFTEELQIFFNPGIMKK